MNKQDEDDENIPYQANISQMKQSSSKPVSTIVGRAFDAMELEALQAEVNKQQEEEKKQTLLGRSLSALKQTLMGGKKNNDADMKAALAAIKEGESLLKNKPENKKDLKNNFIEPKSNVKVIKTLKDSKKEPPKTSEKNNTSKLDNTSESTEKKDLDWNNLKKNNKTKSSLKASSLEDEYYYEEEVSEAKQEVEELSQELGSKVKIIADKVTIFFMNFFSAILRLLLAIISPIIKILPKSKKEEVLPEKAEEVKIEEKPVEPVKGTFNEVLELNIMFTDNYDTALYKKSGVSLSKAEEEIIIANAILAIQQCAEFTKNSPPITEGIFKDKQIDFIMETVTTEELSLFLGYVKSKPKKYIGKTWKISETFATWLLNGTPLGS
ncbi:MAG: hypothetical protein U0457_08890 [Candidatus Sericytochromatia bacterium]